MNIATKRPMSKLRAIYPDGMHNAIGNYLKKQPGFEVRTATLDEPEHGLTEAVLSDTDVLIWWGHGAHGEVTDEVVDRMHVRILDGMGLICLALVALLQDLHQTDGDIVQPQMA